MKKEQKKKVLVIGLGFYGAAAAEGLAGEYDVTAVDKNDTVFGGISGDFGARGLRAGLHYPESSLSTEQCGIGAEQFAQKNHELIVEPKRVIYAIGKQDAAGNPSKTTVEKFKSLVAEKPAEKYQEIDIKDNSDYANLLYAVDAAGSGEYGVAFGAARREFFAKRLQNADVNVRLSFTVEKIEKSESGFNVMGRMKDGTEIKEHYDVVINATAYRDSLTQKPQELFGLKIGYQVCIGLLYEDLNPVDDKPSFFTVLNGEFPCMMPYQDGEGKHPRYLVTHVKYTNKGPYNTVAEAETALSQLNDDYIQEQVKNPAEAELERFLKTFNTQRFKFVGWKATILAKTQTKQAFRTGFVYENEVGVIECFPGKITDTDGCVVEIKKIIEEEILIENQGCQYVRGGILDRAIAECVSTKPHDSLAKESAGGEAAENYDAYNNRSNLCSFSKVPQSASRLKNDKACDGPDSSCAVVPIRKVKRALNDDDFRASILTPSSFFSRSTIPSRGAVSSLALPCCVSVGVPSSIQMSMIK